MTFTPFALHLLSSPTTWPLLHTSFSLPPHFAFHPITIDVLSHCASSSLSLHLTFSLTACTSCSLTTTHAGFLPLHLFISPTTPYFPHITCTLFSHTTPHILSYHMYSNLSYAFGKQTFRHSWRKCASRSLSPHLMFSHHSSCSLSPQLTHVFFCHA